MIILDEVFKKFLEDKNTTFLYKNAIEPQKIFNWNHAEQYINMFRSGQEIVTIGDNNRKSLVHKNTNYSSIDKIVEQIDNGNSFIFDSMERYTKELFYVSNLFSIITNKYVSSNIYGGLHDSAKSFHIHADSQYILILQLDGICDWTVYKETWTGKKEDVTLTTDETLSIDIESTLFPGDVLYLPYRRYHRCIPKSKRLSVSVSADAATNRPKKYGDWFKFN